MEKIRITFPNGDTVHAALTGTPFRQEWPMPAVEKLICSHALSSGCLIGAFGRPSQEPVKDTAGEKEPAAGQLQRGDILFGGGAWWLCYGKCTVPDSIAPVVGSVVEADLEKYEAACREIWIQYYHHRTMSVIEIAREEG